MTTTGPIEDDSANVLSHPRLFARNRVIADTYSVGDQLGTGNSGEVYAVESIPDGRSLALKVFIPFYELRQLSFADIDASLTSGILNEGDFSGAEYKFLSRIDHPFIVQVFGSGTVELDKGEADRLRAMLSRKTNPPGYEGKPFRLPFVVTARVEGVPIHQALDPSTAPVLQSADALRALLGVAQGLEYLHTRHRYLHADIKPANVLIRSSDSFPVLIDFALCKNLNFEDNEVDPDEELARLQLDWSLTPDSQLTHTHPFRLLMREGGTRRRVREALFPWIDYFQYGELLRSLLPHLTPILTPPDLRYVESLVTELTTWPRVTALGHGDLVSRVERIGSREIYSVPLSDTGFVEVLPAGRNVVVPQELKPVRDSLSFSRLKLVNQLSFLAFITEGAKHSRSLHAYDTLRVAQSLTARLSQTPVFRQLFGRNEVLHLWAISLLHDINHVPFLHVLQESRLPTLSTLPLLDITCGGDSTGEREGGRPSVYDLVAELGIERPRFRRLLLNDWHDQTGAFGSADRVISSVIKSGVDVDKLSYLVLDSMMTGSGTAQGLNVDELLDAATVCEVERHGQTGCHLAFRITGLSQVEAALNARLQSFQTIYWRPENRALMAIFIGVMRRLFIDQGADLTAFLTENLFASDFSFVRQLDRLAESVSGESAGLAQLLLRQAEWPVAVVRSRSLHTDLMRLNHEERVAIEERVTEDLCQFASMKEGVTSGRSRIVIDIPERDLDLGGSVYVETSPGKAEPIERVSSAVGQLTDRYHELSRTATVFVDAELASALLEKCTGDSSRVSHEVWSMFGFSRSEVV